MTKITPSLLLASLLALCLHVASAQAQYVRTCVSMARTPCRTFARAHSQTLSDGEITVLDPGDYGGLTITKSISINNDSGGEASITVTVGTFFGIIVNAPADGYVNLRGLTIQGVGFGGSLGLLFRTGFSLTMTNCVVRNHTGDGIQFIPNASSNLSVSNTLVADNGGSGINLTPTGSGTVKAVFNRIEAYNNSIHGILVIGAHSTGTINATAADSVAANNSARGFSVGSAAGQAATSLMVVRSVAANNNAGVFASNSLATVRIGQSTVTGNATGLSTSSGASVLSYGDNNIDGNGDGDPAPTTIPKK